MQLLLEIYKLKADNLQKDKEISVFKDLLSEYKIDKVLENEKCIIEWLMSIYSDKKQRNLLSDFIEKIHFSIFIMLSAQDIINIVYSLSY